MIFIAFSLLFGLTALFEWCIHFTNITNAVIPSPIGKQPAQNSASIERTKKGVQAIRNKPVKIMTVKATFRSSRTLQATAFAVSKPGVLRTRELAVRKIFVYIVSIKIVGNTKPTVKTETLYALLSVIDLCICESAAVITATSHAVDIEVLYTRVVNVP